MRTFKSTVDINAAPEAVWAIVTDFPNMPKWFKGLRKVTLPDAPKTGVGTRRNVSPGGPLVMQEVVTHWEENRLFGYSVRAGVPGLKAHQGLIEIAPLGQGRSRVTYATSLETAIPLPGDPVGFVSGTVMNVVIGGALRELKKLAEKASRSPRA